MTRYWIGFLTGFCAGANYMLAGFMGWLDWLNSDKAIPILLIIVVLLLSLWGATGERPPK